MSCTASLQAQPMLTTTSVGHRLGWNEETIIQDEGEPEWISEVLNDDCT